MNGNRSKVHDGDSVRGDGAGINIANIDAPSFPAPLS